MTREYYSLKSLPFQQFLIYEKKLNHWLHENLVSLSIDFQSLSSIANELWEMKTPIDTFNTLNIYNQNVFNLLLKENIEPIYPEDKLWIDKSRMPHQASFFKVLTGTDRITTKRRNFIVFVYTGNSRAEETIYDWIKNEEELVDIYHEYTNQKNFM